MLPSGLFVRRDIRWVIVCILISDACSRRSSHSGSSCEHASEIKMHTITHLADYLDMFSKNLESRGVKVHWAKDAQEFNEIVLGILKDHNEVIGKMGNRMHLDFRRMLT